MTASRTPHSIVESIHPPHPVQVDKFTIILHDILYQAVDINLMEKNIKERNHAEQKDWDYYRKLSLKPGGFGEDRIKAW